MTLTIVSLAFYFTFSALANFSDSVQRETEIIHFFEESATTVNVKQSDKKLNEKQMAGWGHRMFMAVFQKEARIVPVLSRHFIPIFTTVN